MGDCATSYRLGHTFRAACCRKMWLPFVDVYRTFCWVPDSRARALLEVVGSGGLGG
jgi:hypothetical protein